MREVIWISARKMAPVLMLLLVVPLATSQITGEGYYSGQDSGFSVPEYESQTQLLTELVAPFLFLSVLLHFVLVRVLHFTLRDEEYAPYNPYGYHEKQPNVRRYSLLMSVVITGMLIPTVLWDYMVWAIRFLGAASMTVFAGIVLFVLYMMVSSGKPDGEQGKSG